MAPLPLGPAGRVRAPAAGHPQNKALPEICQENSHQIPAYGYVLTGVFQGEDPENSPGAVQGAAMQDSQLLQVSSPLHNLITEL